MREIGYTSDKSPNAGLNDRKKRQSQEELHGVCVVGISG